MDTEQKIRFLKLALQGSYFDYNSIASDPKVKAWIEVTGRRLVAIFGEYSNEVKSFDSVRFQGDNGSRAESAYILEDALVYCRELFDNYISDFEAHSNNAGNQAKLADSQRDSIDRVFVSHSSKDKEIVAGIVDLIEVMGLRSDQIFCSSLEGRSIAPGEDFMLRLKNEISSNTLVLFILTHNFYESPVSLCEMGAAWVLSKAHVPILIPPFDFPDVKGVFQTTQGLVVNDAYKLSSLREMIRTLFSITDKSDHIVWEQKRNRFIASTNSALGISK